MEQVRDVAQSVEYTSGGREVARSNRVIPTRLQGSPLQPFFIFSHSILSLIFPLLFFSFILPLFPHPSSRVSVAAIDGRPLFRSMSPLLPSLLPTVPLRVSVATVFVALCSPPCPRGGRVWPPHLRPASRCCLSSSLVPCPRPRPFLAALPPVSLPSRPCRCQVWPPNPRI